MKTHKGPFNFECISKKNPTYILKQLENNLTKKKIYFKKVNIKKKI